MPFWGPLGMRALFTNGPGPDAGASKLGNEGCAHIPEKFGIDAPPWLGCCVNAGDENRAVVPAAAMMIDRMMGSSH
jgi:hypothetical protein